MTWPARDTAPAVGPAGAGRALGLYQARDAAQMQAILESLPLAP